MDLRILCSALFLLLVGGPSGCLSDKWWQNIAIYQIYPLSFYDFDGDGVGDLKGIEAKASYLSELGVGAIWINPFYKSPKVDNGYDISDYREIDPVYGTIKDFESLLQTLRTKYSIEVILDFVPNHTSDQHEWFQKSIKRIDPYTDYYVWADPKEWENEKPIPPNNWRSVLGGGIGWEWNDERKQFYYHAFMKEQPDVNFRNPKVVEEMKEILVFWMKKGVKGFRVDAVPWLYEHPDLLDEPEENFGCYTQNLPENYELIQDLRAFLDEYSQEHNLDVFITTEAYAAPEAVLRYYGTSDRPGAHFPFNFNLLNRVRKSSDASKVNTTIVTYLHSLKGRYPNWVSGNHDKPRIPTRMGSSSSTDIINMLNLLLPGTSTSYMGDEIGMDSYHSIDRSKCPPKVANDYRTPCRTPFHWSHDKNAGFTTNDKPWIPVNPEYYDVNVASQRTTCNQGSTTFLKNFKKMTQLKKYPAFAKGKISTFILSDYNVFAFTRTYRKSMYVIVMNLGRVHSEPLNIYKDIPETRRAILMDIAVKSVNIPRDVTSSQLLSRKFSLPPKSGLVLSFRLTS